VTCETIKKRQKRKNILPGLSTEVRLGAFEAYIIGVPLQSKTWNNQNSDSTTRWGL